jgi:hypothetical protein
MKIAPILLAILGGLLAGSAFGQTKENLDEKIKRETFLNTVWGPATNNLQFGVRICAVGPKIADRFKVFTRLYDAGSTNIYGLWKLPPGYRLEMTLTNQAGEAIDQTGIGRALCKTPTRDVPAQGRVAVLEPKAPMDYDKEFDLRDCFQLKKPGTYILTVKPRLYVLDAVNDRVPLEVPPVSIAVVLGENDLNQ